VLCHLILTGKLLFEAESPLDMLVKHMTDPPPRASEVSEVKPELDAPLQRMLAKLPADRPDSVGAALDELMGAAESAGYDVKASTPRSTVSVFSARGGAAVIVSDRKLGTAKTVVVSSATPGPAETDVRKTPRRLLPLAAAAFVVGVLVTGVVVVSKPRPAPTQVAVAHSPSVVLTAPAPSPSPLPSPALSVALPTEVAITVETIPAKAMLSAGTHTSSAPGPLRLPYGTEPVTIKVTAAGYHPGERSVVPTASSSVSITLQRIPAAPPAKPCNPLLDCP
jgi:serine/threonine protein kinase